MINQKSGIVFRDLTSANQGGAQGHRGYYEVAYTVNMEVRFPLLISTPFDLSRRERRSCAVFHAKRVSQVTASVLASGIFGLQ